MAVRGGLFFRHRLPSWGPTLGFDYIHSQGSWVKAVEGKVNKKVVVEHKATSTH